MVAPIMLPFNRSKQNISGLNLRWILRAWFLNFFFGRVAETAIGIDAHRVLGIWYIDYHHDQTVAIKLRPFLVGKIDLVKPIALVA